MLHDNEIGLKSHRRPAQVRGHRGREGVWLILCGHAHFPPPPTSELQCVHFGSWDSHKNWSLSLPSKESVAAIATGNGWVAAATNKQLLRVFTVGGVQREVISVPGHVITLAGWGPRLAIIYQLAPCIHPSFVLLNFDLFTV